jgi:hypothetical protein
VLFFFTSNTFHTPKWIENYNLRTNNIHVFFQKSVSTPVKLICFNVTCPLIYMTGILFRSINLISEEQYRTSNRKRLAYRQLLWQERKARSWIKRRSPDFVWQSLIDSTVASLFVSFLSNIKSVYRIVYCKYVAFSYSVKPHTRTVGRFLVYETSVLPRCLLWVEKGTIIVFVCNVVYYELMVI